FWSQNGFASPAPETAAKVPAAFIGNPAPWNVLQLRDEAAMAPSIEKEFAVFREMQKEETDRLFRQARVMKLVAGVVLLIGVSLLAVWFFGWVSPNALRQK